MWQKKNRWRLVEQNLFHLDWFLANSLLVTAKPHPYIFMARSYFTHQKSDDSFFKMERRDFRLAVSAIQQLFQLCVFLSCSCFTATSIRTHQWWLSFPHPWWRATFASCPRAGTAACASEPKSWPVNFPVSNTHGQCHSATVWTKSASAIGTVPRIQAKIITQYFVFAKPNTSSFKFI